MSVSIENTNTRNREIRALTGANQEFKAAKLTIITMNEEEIIEQNGLTIHVKPIIKWVLEDDIVKSLSPEF